MCGVYGLLGTICGCGDVKPLSIASKYAVTKDYRVLPFSGVQAANFMTYAEVIGEFYRWGGSEKKDNQAKYY